MPKTTNPSPFTSSSPSPLTFPTPNRTSATVRNERCSYTCRPCSLIASSQTGTPAALALCRYGSIKARTTPASISTIAFEIGFQVLDEPGSVRSGCLPIKLRYQYCRSCIYSFLTSSNRSRYSWILGSRALLLAGMLTPGGSLRKLILPPFVHTHEYC